MDEDDRRQFIEWMIETLEEHQICPVMARWYAEKLDPLLLEYPDIMWHDGPYNTAIEILGYMDEWRKMREST